VPAVSRESFEQAYRQIGLLLCIPGVTDPKADVKQLVKAKLSDEVFGQWLMFVDNADDENILFDPLNEANSTDRLIDYLPNSRKGSIVFTVRSRWAAVKLAESNTVQLTELDEKEASKMLEQCLPQKELLEDDEIVHEFLGMLTYLPLAIVQAVAFILENNIRLSEYITIYKGSEKAAIELLSQDFEDLGRYRQTRNPMAITLFISFNKIREQDKLAAEYLSLMACTTGDAVPASLLWPGSTKLATIEALGTLNAYAFVTERQQQQQPSNTGAPFHERSFDIHRLVHLAARNWLREQNLWHFWVSKTLTRLVEIVPPGDHNTMETWTAYLPHAMHVIEMPEAYELEDRISLLARVGYCEQTLGRYRAAERAHRQVLRSREQKLGKENPATLTSMNGVALALGSQGKYVEAEVMHREMLALSEKISGMKYSDTLTLQSMNNLAHALSSQEKYVEAELIHQEELALSGKLSGKEQAGTFTMTSMSNLACTLSSQGKYAEAEAICRETLALREKVLGKEHPDTLVSMNNLAHALSSQGNYAEADAVYRETLALREKVLGKEHPDTLVSMNNLAHALSSQGNYTEAEAIHRETLALEERVLGKNHPHTLVSMNNLAHALSSQGNYTEAEAIHRETLALEERVLGKNHPHTLVSMNNLAYAMSSQGNYAAAEAIYRETLALEGRVLGREHPRTLMSMLSLARTLSSQGKHVEAEAIDHEGLVLRQRISRKTDHVGVGTEESWVRDQLGTTRRLREKIGRKEPQLESGEASTYGGTTIGDNESIDTGQTLVQSTISKTGNMESTSYILLPTRTKDDDDIRSVLSEEEDNESEESTTNTRWSNNIENAIASLLATNSILAPVYEKALQLMHKERFVGNFRRILKMFHEDLKLLDKTVVTQELAAILRSKEARERIATKIIDRHIVHHDLQNEQDLRKARGVEEPHILKLEGWLNKSNLSFLPESADGSSISSKDVRTTVIPNEEEEEDRKGRFGNMDMAQFPRIDLVMQKLVEGEPFQDMIARLKEFLLPTGLLRDILPIPRANIMYDSNKSHGLLNALQELLEDLTKLEWDWWPLPPRMRPLNKGETRVFWRCVSILNLQE
jgi:tetratricopeptide (TPR) repeat protein